MFSRNGTTKAKFNFGENVMEDSEEILTPGFGLEVRGYEVTAIVVCLVIVVAIFMCYLTWKFRYKIVLRTKTYETTVVQNLVALTLQEMNLANENMIRRNEKVPQSLYDFGRHDRQNFPDIIVEECEEPQCPATLTKTVVQSDRKRPCLDRKVSETKSEGKLRTESITSRESDLQVASLDVRERRSRFRNRSNSMPHRRGKYHKKQRALVLSAVKLSSGQSLPRRVDPRKLCDGRYHPLNEVKYHRSSSSPQLEVEVEEDRRRKLSDLQKIKEDQVVGEDQMVGEEERAMDIMDLVLKDVGSIDIG